MLQQDWTGLQELVRKKPDGVKDGWERGLGAERLQNTIVSITRKLHKRKLVLVHYRLSRAFERGLPRMSGDIHCFYYCWEPSVIALCITWRFDRWNQRYSWLITCSAISSAYTNKPLWVTSHSCKASQTEGGILNIPTGHCRNGYDCL